MQSPPSSQVASANDHLYDDRIFARVPPPDINIQVGHGLQHLRVEFTNLLATLLMGSPSLVVVSRCFPKRIHYAIEIVLIFPSDVLFNNPHSSGHCSDLGRL